MTDKLKPCPFCGSEGAYIERPESRRVIHEIYCSQCELTLLETSKEAVIKLWNTRPIEDALRAQLAATKARLAAYEEGCDPKVHPAPDTWVLMKNCDDEFFPVQWHSEAGYYWNFGDGKTYEFWYDDNIDLRKWFPWLGSKGGEA